MRRSTATSSRPAFRAGAPGTAAIPAAPIAARRPRRCGTTPPSDEQRAPAEHRQRRGCRSSPASVAPSGTQTIVDRHGDRPPVGAARTRPPAPRRSASRRRGRCPPAAAARRASRPSATRGGQRHHAEDDHAAKQRRRPPEPIAGQARDRAADHHAGVAERDDRREVAARHAPLAHHRRNDDAEQLVVDAVEDDRQRGERDEPLLVAGPAALSSRRPTSTRTRRSRPALEARRGSRDRPCPCSARAAGRRTAAGCVPASARPVAVTASGAVPFSTHVDQRRQQVEAIERAGAAAAVAHAR